MGLARDAVGVRWFPAGLSIVEQGEPSASLYLIMSGHAEIVRESGGMPLRATPTWTGRLLRSAGTGMPATS